MSKTPSVETARQDARTARQKLLATVQELQYRMEPSNLLDSAVNDVRARSSNLMRTASNAARERPATTTVVAVTGVALLLRKPLLRFGRRLFRRGKATDGEAAS